MKILIIQENGHHEQNRHFRECFCWERAFDYLHHEVDVWGLGHSNFSTVPDFNSYDIIINTENYNFDWIPSLSEYKNPVKFLCVVDAHCRGMDVYNQLFESGRYDLKLQATKDFVDKNSVWFPNCYDNELIYKMDTIEKSHFVGFCGSVLNRQSDLDLLQRRFNLELNVFVLGQKMVETVNSYKIHFNKNISNDINYRSFETLGCGTVLLTNNNHQYNDLGFVDGHNCILYDDTRDMMNKLKYYRENEDELIDISNNALELAKRHTFRMRAHQLITIYGEMK